MKFYIVSIASIFLALAIGIYIGFSLNSKDFLIEQKEGIVEGLEKQFADLRSENDNLKNEMEGVEKENQLYKDFSKAVYPEVIKNKLNGIKIAIIETTDDYVYSGLGQDLKMAGGNVVSITTIKDDFDDEEFLKKIYENHNIAKKEGKSYVQQAMEDLTNYIITSEKSPIIDYLNEDNIIGTVGEYNEPVDYIIVAGGANTEDPNRVNLIDKEIIEFAKKNNIPVIGIEKENVNYSYISYYKDLRITTVDNADTIMGKTALILAMEGRPGNYGVKSTSEELIPNVNYPITNE
jgi:hypothetical protein